MPRSKPNKVGSLPKTISGTDCGSTSMTYLVARDAAALSKVELREYGVPQLGAYKTPNTSGFLVRLPRGPCAMGQRRKVRELPQIRGTGQLLSQRDRQSIRRARANPPAVHLCRTRRLLIT